ncbi:hypothetical protein N7E81_11030 [Reichenbachiella carrageenanivorans]|uniref:DUF4369 domain-containing protein n=1 Tax=Reichenbachiella carrageenanivorans TaxID=2979869 RepID=A0ABY6CVG8_9BACT|nr:hypothetical protein [Reichenbachiella carrageenanivorans]UXX77901.1 hypothetical protein N7E81_11030 [Reichenbachiella carrageenanivorans]
MSVLVFSQCSDDSTGEKSYAVVGQFDGDYSLDYVSHAVEGRFSVENDGTFTLQTFAGELAGSAIEEEGVYDLTLDEFSGVFDNLSGVSGTYDAELNI